MAVRGLDDADAARIIVFRRDSAVLFASVVSVCDVSS